MAERIRLLAKAADLPKPRGPLMDADAIARDQELFNGTVSAKWVRANVPHRVKLGHSTVRWYRDDVSEFIASRRESAA